MRRDSYHMGGTYFRGGTIGAEELIVQPNRDEDPEPIEVAFREYPVLLTVNRSDRADELRGLLERVPDLVFLRRDVRTAS